MGTVTKVVVILGTLLLPACGQTYDKGYYEKISGIKIPDDASLIETFDNGEFLTVTSFKVTPSSITELRKTYNFEAVDGTILPGFFGNNILKGPKPRNSDLNKCLMKIQ